jgi:hypothetical protein
MIAMPRAPKGAAIKGIAAGWQAGAVRGRVYRRPRR